MMETSYILMFLYTIVISEAHCLVFELQYTIIYNIETMYKKA